VATKPSDDSPQELDKHAEIKTHVHKNIWNYKTCHAKTISSPRVHTDVYIDLLYHAVVMKRVMEAEVK